MVNGNGKASVKDFLSSIVPLYVSSVLNCESDN